MDYLMIIAAVASVVGAIFAAWRWDYARKAFIYQKRQLFLQVLMLSESREYWKSPKSYYVGKHCNDCKDPNELGLKILDLLKEVVPK